MTKTVESIHNMVDSAILKESAEKSARSYMGASGLGEECDRALWCSYHHPTVIDKAIVHRKFAVGHALEPVVLSWLEKAGFKLWTVDSNGEQFGFTDGVIAGHVDAIIKGVPGDEETPYLGEVKTANQFNFKSFQKNGIKHNSKYLVQVHVYMHKLKLKKCLFIVVNKDSQELYFEIIEIDEFIAVTALQRGFNIAEMKEEPERRYPNKSYFKCKFCSYYSRCWK